MLPAIKHWPLPWERQLEQRATESIDLVVMHCTELPDMTTAREYGEQVHYPSGTGNSGHFYIDRDGSVARFVACQYVAHHVRDYNARSIGIELVNTGRWPTWLDSRSQAMTEAYPEAQVESLLGLLALLQRQLPGIGQIAGHEDLDRERVPASDDANRTVYRKRDPGPAFPWRRVLHATGLQRLQPHGPRPANA